MDDKCNSPGQPAIQGRSKRAQIDKLKSDMIASQEGDGYLWNPEVRDEFIKQAGLGNPNGVYFRYTKYGLSIHNLYPDDTIYMFKMGWIRNQYQALVRVHNYELNEGRWTDGSFDLPN